MEYPRQETMAWHERLYAYHEQRDRQMQHTFQEMAAGRCPQLQPAQSPPPQPVLLTFEEFLTQNPGPSPVSTSQTIHPKHTVYSTQSYIPLTCLFNIQGTGGSTVGGGLRSTPESRSPTTPIHGGGGGGGGGLGGSAAASSDDLGFGGLLWLKEALDYISP